MEKVDMLNKTEINKTLAEFSGALISIASEQNMPEPFQQALRRIHDQGVDANLNDLKLAVKSDCNRDWALITKAIGCFSKLQATYNYLTNGGQPVLVWKHKQLGTIETSTEDYILVQGDRINTIVQAVTGTLRPDEEHWLELID